MGSKPWISIRNGHVHSRTEGRPPGRHRVRRVLPIAGNVLVKVGDHVDAEQIVAQTFMPGDVTPLNLANVLSISPGDVKASLLKQEGERIAVGELLARTKGIFGLFKNEYRSKVGRHASNRSRPSRGRSFCAASRCPCRCGAYLSGTVIEVLPNEGVVHRSRRHLDPRDLRHRRRSLRADRDGLSRSLARN